MFVIVPVSNVVGIAPDDNVPTDVKEDAVTPLFSVAPVNVPAAAVTVTFVVPSNEVPFIVLAVCSA
ncbi:hypothetical protein, partial [Escherichia coli]|uniref:hypothetical protein n=1 Tax=Escherichia coli TaxID=562 RepID=UPI001BDCB285